MNEKFFSLPKEKQQAIINASYQKGIFGRWFSAEALMSARWKKILQSLWIFGRTFIFERSDDIWMQ